MWFQEYHCSFLSHSDKSKLWTLQRYLLEVEYPAAYFPNTQQRCPQRNDRPVRGLLPCYIFCPFRGVVQCSLRSYGMKRTLCCEISIVRRFPCVPSCSHAMHLTFHWLLQIQGLEVKAVNGELEWQFLLLCRWKWSEHSVKQRDHCGKDHYLETLMMLTLSSELNLDLSWNEGYVVPFYRSWFHVCLEIDFKGFCFFWCSFADGDVMSRRILLKEILI